MPRIGLLTDSWGPSLVLQSLSNLRDRGLLQLETIEDIRTVDSLERAVWSLINLVDVIVASVNKGSPHIYYEIGLAHGLGKPVILVDESGRLSSPPFLTSQRTLQVDRTVENPDALAFRIQQAIDEALTRERPFSGPRAVPSRRSYEATNVAVTEIEDFRSLFGLPSTERPSRFEGWFESLARAIPGWEVVGAEPRTMRPADSFDLAIWNSREDSDLLALGNPVVVECSSFNAEKVRRTLHQAISIGLKGIVLATMNANGAAIRRHVMRASEGKGILVITLDREDLIEVREPEQLVRLIKRKVRELQFGGDM